MYKTFRWSHLCLLTLCAYVNCCSVGVRVFTWLTRHVQYVYTETYVLLVLQPLRTLLPRVAHHRIHSDVYTCLSPLPGTGLRGWLTEHSYSCLGTSLRHVNSGGARAQGILMRIG